MSTHVCFAFWIVGGRTRSTTALHGKTKLDTCLLEEATLTVGGVAGPLAPIGCEFCAPIAPRLLERSLCGGKGLDRLHVGEGWDAACRPLVAHGGITRMKVKTFLFPRRTRVEVACVTGHRVLGVLENA